MAFVNRVNPGEKHVQMGITASFAMPHVSPDLSTVLLAVLHAKLVSTWME